MSSPVSSAASGRTIVAKSSGLSSPGAMSLVVGPFQRTRAEAKVTRHVPLQLHGRSRPQGHPFHWRCSRLWVWEIGVRSRWTGPLGQASLPLAWVELSSRVQMERTPGRYWRCLNCRRCDIVVPRRPLTLGGRVHPSICAMQTRPSAGAAHLLGLLAPVAFALSLPSGSGMYVCMYG